MKILFVITHDGLIRHIGRVIEQAAAAGHEVILTIGKKKKGLVTQQLDELSAIPGVRTTKFFKANFVWQRILKTTRALLDIGVYFRPDHTSPELVDRYKKIFPPGVLAILTRPLMRRLVASRTFRYFLRRVEMLAPPPRAIRESLQKLKPDVVVTTPYLFPATEDIDYLKAAAREKIPTCAAIPSWDNFTTKGTCHVPVDRLFVWNEELKAEAIGLHGINASAITITGAPTFDHLFKWSATQSRQAFCASAGIPADKPVLLYLCSSGSIARDEAEVVRQFADALARHEATRNCLLLVRPHPLNSSIWETATPLPENVRIYPGKGDLPDNPKSIEIYCHSIHYSEAMIGLNTSAFLEASVLDRACIALPTLGKFYEQERFGHFKHLVNGNFIHRPDSLLEAAELLGDLIVSKEDPLREARCAFVKHFLRPKGLDLDASTVMLDAIVEAGGRPAQAAAMRNFFSSPPVPDLAAQPQNTIAYVLIGLAHFPYHESVISALSRAGYGVDLVILKHRTASYLDAELSEQPEVAETVNSFKRFLRDHPRVRVVELSKHEIVVPRLPFALRFFRSLASYIRRLPPDNFYRQRWLGYMQETLGNFCRMPALHWFLKLPFAEHLLYRLDLHYPPPSSVLAKLKGLHPVMVVASPGNMRYNPEVEWLKAAARLGIPTAIVALSWDNLTTKGLIHIRPDYLFVWNDSHAEDAKQIHRMPEEATFIVGAPFFDKWCDTERLLEPRASFMSSIGLDPGRKYIVYLGSSANIADNESWLIREIHEHMRNSSDPALESLQLLVRPHPNNRKICADLEGLSNVLTQNEDAGIPATSAKKRLLFNTLYHAELTISLNTSAIIDAIAIGKPCISVKTEKYQDTHTGSAHFKNLLDANAVVMANGVDDCIQTIARHLAGADPSRQQRQDFVRRFIRSGATGRTAGESIALITQRLLAGETAPSIKQSIELTTMERRHPTDA